MDIIQVLELENFDILLMVFEVSMSDIAKPWFVCTCLHI
jgi:hypothetical protein